MLYNISMIPELDLFDRAESEASKLVGSVSLKDEIPYLVLEAGSLY